ncbi:hypothetical protein HYZ99_01430 [Candidatus Peregrinibacteria bacterium]|nr:hypothetical protein [Candidatus Peregrinibacteria bacterium]
MESSGKSRLESLDSNRLLVIQDRELQGIKDRALTEKIRQFEQGQIRYLSVSAASGKVRHLASKLLADKREFGADRYVHKHLPEARKKFAKESTLAMKDLAQSCQNPFDAALYMALFREKADRELQELPTDELRSLQYLESPWPQDLIEQILQGRSMASPQAAPEHWREQA